MSDSLWSALIAALTRVVVAWIHRPRLMRGERKQSKGR